MCMIEQGRIESGPEFGDQPHCLVSEAAAGAERVAALRHEAMVQLRDAEDNLTTVRNRISGLAAGIAQPVDIDPALDAHALDAHRPPSATAPAGHRLRVPVLLILAVAVAIAATAGAVVSIGVATPAPTAGEAVDRPAIAAGVARGDAAPPSPAPVAAPVADDPGQTIYAARFVSVGAGERLCLARAIYYEARGEAIEGQIAVAQVILNRARSVKWPDTICGVVNQGMERGEKCQFSFACSHHAGEPSGEAWDQARLLADQAVGGQAWLREMLEATHYHTTSVAPVWRLNLVTLGTVGTHVFYREGWGLRAATTVKPPSAQPPHVAAAKPPVRAKSAASDNDWAARMFQP